MKKSFVLFLSILLIMTSVFSVSCIKKIEKDDTISNDGEYQNANNQEQQQNGVSSLRIGSYNIAHSRLVNYDIKTIADEIVSLDLDIVGIQEVDRFAKRSNYVDMLKELVMESGYPFGKYFKAINLEGDSAKYGQEGEYGLIILSKYPIKQSETIELECPNLEQRIVAHAVIDVRGTDIDFYNTHLSFESTAVRSKQFEALANLIEGENPCIITGDFNIEKADEFNVIPLDRINAKDKTYITYPEDQLPLDNVFYTEEFEFVSSNMNVSGHSDHNLIYGEFKFEPEK